MSTQNYDECYEVLSNMYEEVNGEDFYRYIFPNNENSYDKSVDPDKSTDDKVRYSYHYTDYSHPNAIYLYKDERDAGTKRRLRRRVMLNDTWSEDYMKYVERNEMTLCSGLTYHSRSNKLQYAQNMNALIFDLDGVGKKQLNIILGRIALKDTGYRSIPQPTFIVLSGKGLHLYYVFKEPIALYPNIKIQLKSLKYDLTFKIWEYKETSQFKDIQYQSIGQGFRMVGSVNNKYGNEVVAFRTGDKVTLEYLNDYVTKPENRVQVNRRYRPSKVSREQAKELYPEWYQRVVVEGNKRPKKWDIAGKVHGDNPYALYDWWKGQIEQIRGGHRYFFLMCLVIYACKCDVPKKKLKADMQEIYRELKKIPHDNTLTKEDVESAMECYDKEYYNFTLDDIELLTDVHIVRNKRNGRKQADHIKLMNFVRDELNHNTDWRNTDGRPEKKMIVWEWRKQHPDGKKIECEKDTGLSRHTVLKWWDVHIGLKERQERIDTLPMSEWTDADWDYANSEMYESCMDDYTMTLKNWIMGGLSSGKSIDELAEEYQCPVSVVKEYAELKKYLDKRLRTNG